MQNWMRRVALCLAVPLVVGAPALVVAGPASAAQSTTTSSTLDSPTIVYGQETHATATVHSDMDEQPVTAGTVTFEARQAFTSDEFWSIGAPVALNGSGVAVSPPLTSADGSPLGVNGGSDHWEILATFNPAAGSPLASSSDSDLLHVDKSGSTMAILPQATNVVVDVSGLLPGGSQSGSARPSGTVHVTADGQDLGNVGLDPTGRATVPLTLPPGQAHSVSATYAGDSRYTGSSASVVRRDPLIETRILSLFPRSRAGWYRTPVEIWFRCRSMGAELIGNCGRHVSLNESGKNQSVTRTISAVDGGRASATVSDIDIDLEKPEITITGDTCRATDQLSGVRGRCHMLIGPYGFFRAIAHDKAGNRAVEKGVLD
jgi:hypothetical protein